MEGFWGLVTEAGSPETFFVLSALSLMLVLLFGEKMEKGKRYFLILFPLAIFSAAIATEMLKNVFAVERPCIPCSSGISDCNIYCPEGYSFPSGHASVGFAAAASILCVYRKNENLVLLSIPLLISVSRVALGVHTFSDILGGALIGIAIPAILHSFLSSSGISKAISK
ncbi:MAG: phosphatase PAP2 family protein [Candidatus Aenigmarchaeota archaeon]|nr:phosphatase PAP2 family protein [Candidatus Aenigmarchaeota archaeon]